MTPRREVTARAEETSTAAELESPDPSGTSPQRTRGDPGESGEVDCRWHHKALGVVGVLADQVDPARGCENFRFYMEAF